MKVLRLGTEPTSRNVFEVGSFGISSGQLAGLSPVEDAPVKSGLDISYAAGVRPTVISQGGKKAVLTYNADNDRVCVLYSVNDSVRLARYYPDGNYEADETVGGTKEKLYLGGGYYDASAVLVEEGGNASVYFVHRDYLGSIYDIAYVLAYLGRLGAYELDSGLSA